MLTRNSCPGGLGNTGNSGHSGIRFNPFVGSVIDGYCIERKIGGSRMSEVYLASKDEKKVVIKIPIDGERSRAFFEREVFLHGRFKHPNIVRFLDSGYADQRKYLMLQYLPGGTLKTRNILPMKLGEIREILSQICSALSLLHGHGVVHRDVKLENVLNGEADSGLPVVKLCDFGLSRIHGCNGRVTIGNDERYMDYGRVGTPVYMAPEIYLEKGYDHRVDIYACGILAYELFTGSAPFIAEDVDGTRKLIELHIRSKPKAPSTKMRLAAEKSVKDAVDDLVLKALAKKPSERYQSVVEMACDIARIPG